MTLAPTTLLRVIVIDHDDSFTHNVAAALSCRGAVVTIVNHRTLPTFAPSVGAEEHPWDLMVLSPGPGHPRDYPHSLALCAPGFFTAPILGICLGLQIFLAAAGHEVVPLRSRGQSYTHGRRTWLRQPGIPSVVMPGFCYLGHVVHHNSLGVPWPSAPVCQGAADWHYLAQAQDSVLIAEHPLQWRVGVQFHPESYASSLEYDFFGAVLQMAQDFRNTNPQNLAEQGRRGRVSDVYMRRTQVSDEEPNDARPNFQDWYNIKKGLP